MHYRHYSLAPDWRWENFSGKEIACKCCESIFLDENALDKLQKMRDLAQTPMIINSAYRCPRHNEAVGGAKRSQHKQGNAFDVRITEEMPREKIHLLAKRVGFTGFGDYHTFVHIDTGRARKWDFRA